MPQFKRIKEFFENEYYPKTRTSIGISSTPNGKNIIKIELIIIQQVMNILQKKYMK